MERDDPITYETIYVADIMACTLTNGCLSQNDAIQLLKKHGSNYTDFAQECGEVLEAKSILKWLGY